MRGFPKKLGITLCVIASAACAVLHLATFLTMMSPAWILPPFLLIFGAIACASAAGSHLAKPSGKRALVICPLIAYAILTFVYVYKTTGGATSVAVLDGQYVSMYKSDVIRTITEYEYRMFPNLVTRVMSAWIGMMAVLGIMNLTSIPDDLLDRHR